MKNSGFTKIELIIVILLIIIMIAVDIAAVLYLNQKSRDIAVLSDVKQIQSGLDTYLVLTGQYPVAASVVNLNDVYENTEKLCVEGFKKRTDSCSQLILQPVPNSDIQNNNIYKYHSTEGFDYKIEFNLKSNFKKLNLSRGLNCATNDKIISQPCF